MDYSLHNIIILCMDYSLHNIIIYMHTSFTTLFNSIQKNKSIEVICPYLCINDSIIYTSKLRKLTDYYVISALCIYILKIKNFEFLIHIIDKKIIYPALIYFWDNAVFTQEENEANYTIIMKHILDTNIYAGELCAANFICSYTNKKDYSILAYMNIPQLYNLTLYVYGNNKNQILSLINNLILFERSIRYTWIMACIQI